ncbi:MAG: bile acid:sodium symporter [Candidatus Thermoplasmatota archaeon]|nr:bile acid:sodium symporter [Candidatus Thermoplasmatota archaeon]
MRASGVLESYSAMMVLGLVIGLVTGGLPAYTKEVSMASLAILMTLSLSTVRIGDARGREHVDHSLKALIINYGFLTALILLIGAFFEDEYWWGWVLMAAAPSAISVVPFTTILGGKTSKALFSTSVNYLAALVLMPVITLLLIGSAVSSTSLVTSILLLIVLPMAASRAVMRLRLSRPLNTSLTNICFAVLIFAVTGANRDAFVGEPMLVVAISAACVLRTFGTGLGTEWLTRRLRMPKEERITYVLFASYKNLGLTATLAIALFEPLVAVPATICIVFEVVWVIFLLRYYPRVPP